MDKSIAQGLNSCLLFAGVIAPRRQQRSQPMLQSREGEAGMTQYWTEETADGYKGRSEDKADDLNGLGDRFALRVSELTGIVALCRCTSDLTGLSPTVFAIGWDCSAREACASDFAVVA